MSRCVASKTTTGGRCLREALPDQEHCAIHIKAVCLSVPNKPTGDAFEDVRGELQQLILDLRHNKITAANSNALTNACKALLQVAVEQRKVEAEQALEARLEALEQLLDTPEQAA